MNDYDKSDMKNTFEDLHKEYLGNDKTAKSDASFTGKWFTFSEIEILLNYKYKRIKMSLSKTNKGMIMKSKLRKNCLQTLRGNQP